VESVETSNEEEEVRKLLAAILVVSHVRTLYDIALLQEVHRSCVIEFLTRLSWLLYVVRCIGFQCAKHFFLGKGFTMVAGVAIFHAMYELAKAQTLTFLVVYVKNFCMVSFDGTAIS